MSAQLHYFTPGLAPSDIRALSYDFTNLLAQGETVVSASVYAAPSLTLSQPVIQDNVVMTYASGGSLGTVYHIHFVATTQSETLDRVGVAVCQEI